MSLDPFAPQPGQDPFTSRQPHWFPERGTYAPGTYDPRVHEENPVVTLKGVPVPPVFRVFDVAPERRWAILPDGEVMPQEEFRKHLELYWKGYYTLPRPHQPGFNPQPPEGEWHLDGEPRVERWVAVEVDPHEPSRTRSILPKRDEKPVLTGWRDPETGEEVSFDPTSEAFRRTKQIADKYGIELRMKPTEAKEEEKPLQPVETAVPAEEPANGDPVLSKREREVYELKMQGMTNQQIADQLGISKTYVHTLTTKVNKKLRENA